ncbi:hypothetical protein BSNK01_20040 [Bacillaceae bacterium]
MWNWAVLGIIALSCIWAFWQTMKLGKEQAESQEKYYQSKKTYTTLTYIYGIVFILVILLLIWYLAM